MRTLIVIVWLLGILAYGIAMSAHARMCETTCHGGDQYGRGQVCTTRCQ